MCIRDRLSVYGWQPTSRWTPFITKKSNVQGSAGIRWRTLSSCFLWNGFIYHFRRASLEERMKVMRKTSHLKMLESLLLFTVRRPIKKRPWWVLSVELYFKRLQIVFRNKQTDSKSYYTNHVLISCFNRFKRHNLELHILFLNCCGKVCFANNVYLSCQPFTIQEEGPHSRTVLCLKLRSHINIQSNILPK